MIAFVTGGSGFVGRNLLGYLRERGVSVRALARSPASADAVRKLGADPVSGDLDSTEAIRVGLQGCDTVFHAAASVDDWPSEAEAMRTNVDATKRLLELAAAAGVKRFVHVSTEAVLIGGKTMVNAGESWPRPRKPLGIYSRTKALAEMAVLDANREGFATIAVRPRFVWGEGDTSLLPKIVEEVRAGKFAWISGSRNLTSSCHVRSVCEGLFKAAERGTPGAIYFLTDGPPLEFRALLEGLFEAQNVPLPTKSVPYWLVHLFAIAGDFAWRTFRLRGRPPLPHGSFHLFADEVTVDDSRARRELGYSGEMSRGDGLREMRNGLASLRGRVVSSIEPGRN